MCPVGFAKKRRNCSRGKGKITQKLAERGKTFIIKGKGGKTKCPQSGKRLTILNRSHALPGRKTNAWRNEAAYCSRKKRAAPLPLG